MKKKGASTQSFAVWAWLTDSMFEEPSGAPAVVLEKIGWAVLAPSFSSPLPKVGLSVAFICNIWKHQLHYQETLQAD